MRVFLLFAALILASCTPPAGPADAGTSKPPLNPTQACEAKGGAYRQVCLMGEWTCVMPYKDAGKSCTDNEQCEGKQCRYIGSGPPPKNASAVGECKRTTDPCGCFSTIEKGVVQSALCVD